MEWTGAETITSASEQNNQTYTSSGLGSPAIYSTADVRVTGAKLVSNQSEGVCIEGTGSIELTDCGDPAVLALANAGVINGYPDGTFGPAKTLTRAEISKIIYLLTEPA